MAKVIKIGSLCLFLLLIWGGWALVQSNSPHFVPQTGYETPKSMFKDLEIKKADKSRPFYEKVHSIQPYNTRQDIDRLLGIKGKLVPKAEKFAYGEVTEDDPNGTDKIHKWDQYRWNDPVSHSYMISQFPIIFEPDQHICQVLVQVYSN